MSSTHEVISAFLDEEPFDSEELMDALSDPAGRALLIDLVALQADRSADRWRACNQSGESCAAARVADRRDGRGIVAHARRWISGRRATLLHRIVRSAAAHPDRPCRAIRPHWRHSMKLMLAVLSLLLPREVSRTHRRLTKCRSQSVGSSSPQMAPKKPLASGVGTGPVIIGKPTVGVFSMRGCGYFTALSRRTLSRRTRALDGESKSRRRGSSITPSRFGCGGSARWTKEAD